MLVLVVSLVAFSACGNTQKLFTRIDENGVASANGQFVLFGHYATTLKEASVTIDESSLDDNGYYMGSDGNKYAKVSAAPDSSSIVFSDGSQIETGTEYYFKVEKIKWRIVSESNNQAVLVSENVIDCHVYNNSLDDGNKYDTSVIRSYLNGELFEKMFSAKEQELVLTTIVDNSVMSTGKETNPNACDNTEDKVFLLSVKEVSEIVTNLGESFVPKYTTDYAKASGSGKDRADSNLGWWWLRSPHEKYKYASYDCATSGFSCSAVTQKIGGIVPAITLKLN